MVQATSDNSLSTRCNLMISRQTDVPVRRFLIQRGFKRGDLSSFVEDTVRWRVFDQTIAQAKSRLDALARQTAETLLDEALVQVRKLGPD